MRIHTKEKIEKLKLLRRNGYSINELVSELQIPKTTVWHHIQSVDVLPEYVSTLESKRGGSKKLKEHRIIEAQAYSKSLLNSKNRESILLFAMLYWAEGTKKTFVFTNSDGRMVSLWLDVLRNVIGISNNEIVPTMRMFTGMDQNICLNYWSKMTKLPKSKFIVRLNDGGTRGKAKYGMCRIEVRKSNKLLKLVLAVIDQIYSEYTM